MAANTAKGRIVRSDQISRSAVIAMLINLAVPFKLQAYSTRPRVTIDRAKDGEMVEL
jgi:hypothetical protein